MLIRHTTISELEQLLRCLGVRKADTVMVHSSVITLGIVENGLAGLYQAFRNILGEEGTLIVPTFTYSFRRNEVFDVKNTRVPKALGIFSEYVRQLPWAIRSSDPLFSMVAIGPKAEILMQRKTHYCFGRGSIYEKLFDANILILALGITYSTGITAFLHLEKLGSAPYRIDYSFAGTTIAADGSVYDDFAIHFMRDEKRFPIVEVDREQIGAQMESLGISNSVQFGSGKHIALRAQFFADYVLECLKKNKYAMLRNYKIE